MGYNRDQIRILAPSRVGKRIRGIAVAWTESNMDAERIEIDRYPPGQTSLDASRYVA